MTDSVDESYFFQGRCTGGPLDGRTYAVRKSGGFVLADKVTATGWYYDRAGAGFQLRGGQPVRLRQPDAVAIAAGDDYDVIAPPEDPTGEPPLVLGAANPNPGQITNEIWRFWGQFDALEPSAQLGGVYAAKPGYHNYRNALATSDYSRADVANDRLGPGDKAAAIDLTMSDTAMRKYTSRMDAAARARDERLFIGGAPIIREFIGTKDSRTVYCYVLTGGRALGVGADSGPDPGRDETHLWHLHLSIIRRFVATQDAMDRLMSVLRGESLETWKSRGQAPEVEEEDEMSQQVIPLPTGFAYDENQSLIGRQYAISVPVEPAGLASNPVFGSKRLYLSFASDHTGNDPVRVRVAIHNGEGWAVSLIDVPAGGRVAAAVPAAKNGLAFNITIGRIKKTASSSSSESGIPLSVLVTVA
ncbi:hypothetical protein [Catenuloplanes japonicus]|uniref:hypothetical protein n=1 Tax=Catenuloplanes japonicus TaxID=33876 RepID=UPI0006914592|nr:hypothetical protein [Catenuloplanes japonicus]